MKKWLFLLIMAVLAGGAALGVRHYGIDVVALTGLDKAVAAIQGEGKPAQGQAAGQGGQRGNRGPSPVETARATTSQLSDDISAIGTLLADESVSIAPETSGRLAKVLFEDGATVAAGTPLFQLDTDLATASLEEAKARLELAEANFNRNQTLRKSGNVAQSTFETAQTERDVALTAVDSAQVLLKKLTILAPFPGTLGFRSVSEGAYLTAGTPLVQLDKIDKLKVSFSVPELQQSRIAVGQTVEVLADALPDESFNAVVSALDPSIDVNGRALLVRADLDNSASRLKPGLLVRVAVKGQERQAVVVPEAAVVQRGESAFVYTVTDNKAAELKVRLGKRLPGKIEILEGIAAGDTVVTAGNTRLSNGAAVEVVSAAASAE
ncbi:efflux RND transporter periplasmic adaptor subunit [Aestuariivirga sp.]|uniref:efflux RND transporter periplasmic adaptor subunit n=1 Tax=Aestuariivirga sp. TaxID=2650926 RepID=UPI0035938398